MFTGIVQALGTVQRIEERTDARSFWIHTGLLPSALQIGDSLAVNGCCLTVETVLESEYRFTAVRQTLALTNLGTLKVGDQVNLEPAARLDTFLGGHLVSGHVDGLAEVMEWLDLETGAEVKMQVPLELKRYMIPKGSVTLDGTSLTLADLGENWLKIALIPETIQKTIAGSKWRPGQKVNLEVDLVGKYIENFVRAEPERWRSLLVGHN
jgi:riboflavin synthase